MTKPMTQESRHPRASDARRVTLEDGTILREECSCGDNVRRVSEHTYAVLNGVERSRAPIGGAVWYECAKCGQDMEVLSD